MSATTPEELLSAPVEGVTSATESPEYKLIKIKRPDGSITTVRQKVKPGQSSTIAAFASTDQDSSVNTPPKLANDTQSPMQQYKIVSIKKPDGTITKIRRPVKPITTTMSTATEMTNIPEGSSQEPSLVDAHTEQSKTKPELKVVAPTKPVVSLSTPAKSSGIYAAADDTRADQITPLPTSKGDIMPASQANSASGIESVAATKPDADALRSQRAAQLERSRLAYSSAITKGFGVVAGSLIGPHMTVSHEFEAGNVDISDEDWSENDVDSDAEARTEDGSHEHDHGTTNVAFNGGAAAQSAMGAVASGLTGKPPPRQPAVETNAEKGVTNGKDGKSAAISARELNELEAADSLKAASQPLKHHWASFTFYFMASLSIVLPLFLLVVGVFVVLMNKKHTSSTWHVMENLIKATISAWPIIFAAVVAQVLKAWATFKVERGIKLMELEQLVGSNSFGSAVKQPFMLRKLNLLTLVLFLVWCMSPLGTQALQRVYTKKSGTQEDTMDIKYLNMMGFNQAFTDPGSQPPSGFEDLYADPEQRLLEIGTYFAGNFIPSANLDDESKMFQDQFHHPYIQWSDANRSDPYQVSGYGLPIVMEKSRFGKIGDNSQSSEAGGGREPSAAGSKWEVVEFNVDTAYFDVSCGNWSTVSGQFIEDYNSNANGTNPNNQEFVPSISTTLWLLLDKQNNATDFTSIKMASQDKVDVTQVSDVNGTEVNVTANYSYLECSYKQVFVEASLMCSRRPDSDSGMPDCYYMSSTPIPEDRIVNRTIMMDWSYLMRQYGNPWSGDSSTTPVEYYLRYGLAGKSRLGIAENSAFKLGDASNSMVEGRLANVINTFIGLGYCSHCNSYVNTTNIYPQENSLFNTAKAKWTYTTDEVYVIVWAWAGVYIACSALLLLAGVASVIIESRTVAPDVLGYVSTVARNSKYLQVKKTSSAMPGPQRARMLGETKVMMQDVKPGADIGRIALGMKHEKAEKLKPGRLYR